MSPRKDIGPPSEHDVVELKHLLHTEDFAGVREILLTAGTEGTIMEIGELPGQPTGYLVEFCDAAGITLAMPWLRHEDSEIIERYRDLTQHQ
ncbi:MULTISPECIES: DUF4926 domain-containing protein [unclassified Mycolicibacterium]|uniref:DUF4926 domain-containing protein n=1 Tax=unclassified Mycolicibacterium TaxID=2636767 RepID=UPI0012DF642C|nr:MULTISPECIES: DUF4926 domain-containing protein [unclassified Mycolicibacterium]MUL80758.1 DUF4926 domain-containing protein [Mycolicibacterium sp. CBMA 329]MUL86525.1 DUF4926 domain-containing protein [Mycolicibacterium sp. CBMA 331]MUM01386.1 DUF4926 domain-containing protein [Mycolicibacterium sp. CBMA 334]MUM25895.1 DUF4926 domain-containing protein [Mycolicibacterium sp. CBMA 295]MUM36821.1 DUF4926 domain-containing protein [Mycolicibacterium sp. CBMA 247]